MFGTFTTATSILIYCGVPQEIQIFEISGERNEHKSPILIDKSNWLCNLSIDAVVRMGEKLALSGYTKIHQQASFPR